ncbi:unnamed protein product [Cylindrotheca closterium]|uniref:Phospholipid:diacylglycerol acyltransferase n=1 Tax=Cylindrotheca closterium TaxID=2856 RepID=A0AAD2CFM1_9STRA|nr:unnamed protein product [Cylindrotheca closterium]
MSTNKEAADGASETTSHPPNVDESSHEDSVDTSKGEKLDDENTNNSPETAESGDNNMSRKKFLLMFAAIVLAGQWMMYSGLKNHIDSDSGIIPQLQHQLNTFNAFNDTWNRFNQSRTHLTQERLRPGFQLAEEGAHGKYPVIMIPGFVTSGLEIWQGKECAKKYFRTRMWGGAGSVQQWLMERHCVMEHLTLDPVTGKDPEGIRIRSAQGFEAADYFVGNYWVWGKILESLADVGYDGSIMSMESYDWRLSFPKLEERDGFFTKLKYKIEAFHKVTGKKIVLTSHSLGVLLVHYFFAWVSDEDPNWVDNHIHAYVNIAGSHLGVPKAASALLSGEMSDTIFMGTAGSLIEQFIGRKVRCDLWRSWGSLWHMLPKGSDGFWENIITMTDGEGTGSDDDWDILDKDTPMHEAVERFGSYSHHPSSRIIDFLARLGGGYQSETGKKAWHDASKTPLPKAPNMKIYCLYGVGLQTEKAYYYKRNEDEGATDDDLSNPSADVPFVIDTSVEDADNNIIHGIEYTDGDGSVPLESLGYLCADGWRQKGSKLNPSRIPVVTREYEHREEFTVEDPMRRGPHSGDHVDILGHNDALTDLIRIVTDHEVDEVKDNIISNLKERSDEINTRGGVMRRGGIQNAFKRWNKGLRKSHNKLKASKALALLKKIRLFPFQKMHRIQNAEEAHDVKVGQVAQDAQDAHNAT